EQEVLRLYSKRLISKLEQKNLELEKEVLERKKAEQQLIDKNEVLDLIAVNTPLDKIFDRILLNYESHHPDNYGAISLQEDNGTHLNLISAPSMPKAYNAAVQQVLIGDNVGSCGTAAYLKKPVVVSDISKSKSWIDYKDIALKYNLKSCWSLPILSENDDVLGTFAIYSESIKSPTFDEIKEFNLTVSLTRIAIEKHRIAEEIKKKDASYKSLIDQASDAIVTFAIDGTIYDFNKAAHTSLGYTRDEFSKLRLHDINEGPIIENKENYQKALKGEAILFERKFKRKDNTYIDVEISAKLQQDGKILGIARDITEWKKNLRAIQRAKEFSTGLLNSMREGLYAINLESEIIMVNPAFCKMTGFTEQELIGLKRPYPFSPPEVKEDNDKRFNLLKENKNLPDYENTYMNKDGERFPVQVLVSSLHDENGKKFANFATVQDISERKKAEIDLKLAKEFTDKLIMSMQEGLIIVNLKGEIIMVNDAACDIYGYTEDELIGLSMPYPFVINDDTDIIRNAYKMVAGGEPLSFKYKFERKNGERITTYFSTGNIKNNNNEVIALFATIKDITEEEKSKKALEANAILSNKKKDAILELANLVGEHYDTAFNKITKLASQTLEVGRVSIWSFKNDKSEIFCEKLYNLKTNSFERDFVIQYNDNPHYFDELTKKQTIRVADAQNNKITKQFTKDYFKPNNISSLMDVFINSTNGHYGIICFEHVGDTLRDWSADDLQFATSIANIVSLMVESTERKSAEKMLLTSNKQLSQANTELNALREQLEQENVYLRNELDLVFNFEEMVYGSAEFSNVLTEIEKVAPTDATVLLQGESGTGKELLARAIHNISSRNNKPLIKVNCSAIPRELIESELFGHKKGSFTGAHTDKIGKFELADKGTLFLDEIGELPLDMQPKLLRFLQEGEIEVVGGVGTKTLDVRVIAATNRNLLQEIENKKFREDLYFRLNVFPIIVPSLRERKNDIPILVEHFVDKFNKRYGKSIKFIVDEAMTKLKNYNWPGNIRELENLIERALILSNGETLQIPGFESSSQHAKAISDKDLSLDTAQRTHILQVLDQCDWKITGENGAAEILKLKPSTLRDRMKKLEIKKG
ncbi:MAG: sigma 54-interacting transcriptional regulator, partial [Winogradskyella sp.]|uniref:sigma 54-interacting transcriptional regulator n=1 Tax=Winogradskyella sp. TaxID=1883156 RepID=UPI0017BF5EE7|nr:sigma 54-interacting transcriptional regulator [Winogradskyella sp.]